MPDGKTHDMLTVVTGVIGIPALLALVPDRGLGGALIWCSAHVVSGMAFSPDLDLASEPYRRWGPLRFIWWPYREAISHRAWVSHSLVFGPLLRLAYFFIMSSLVLWITLTLLGKVITIDAATPIKSIWKPFVDMWIYQRPVVWMILAGFVTGGAVHSIADWTIEGKEPFHRSLWRKTPFARLFRRRRRRYAQR